MELIVRNKQITAPIAEILNEVKRQLTNGKLREIKKEKHNNILISCPRHKEGLENRASCQVYSSYDSNELLPGTTHCFVCDYKATLPKLIADLFDEGYEFGEDWLLSNFGEVWDSFQYLPEIELNNKKQQQYLDESILDRFNQYTPYIEKRGIDIDIARKFKVGYDAETDCITFPVWDEHDKLKMITKRSTKGKMFYIDADIDKPVYLLNEIIKQNITTVYVTESQIDALNLWSWGYPAIALIGLGSKNQYEILNKSGIRSYILCLDNDIWGEKGRDRFRQNIRKDIFISDFRITNNKKDINDLTKEEFESMLLI